VAPRPTSVGAAFPPTAAHGRRVGAGVKLSASLAYGIAGVGFRARGSQAMGLFASRSAER